MVKNHERPLRKAAAKGADPSKFEEFVERCSAEAEQADVYVVDVRIAGGAIPPGTPPGSPLTISLPMGLRILPGSGIPEIRIRRIHSS